MIPLYRPRVLAGRYLRQALRHPATGPMVRKLRQELAGRFQYPEECVVLANSATACFEALCRYEKRAGRSGKWQMGEPCWPLFWRHRGCRDAYLDTHIGGPHIPSPTPRSGMFTTAALDFSHSWEVPPRGAWTAAFGSVSPVKLLCGVGGGAMFVECPARGDHLQTSIDYGFSSHGGTRDWRDCRLEDARRDNMSDIAAAFALEALEHLDSDKDAFSHCWERMFWELPAELDDPCQLDMLNEGGAAHSLLQIRLRSPKGEFWPVSKLRQELARCGIASGHQFPFSPESLLEWEWTTVPCNPNLTEDEHRHIVLTLVKLARREP